MGKKLIRIRRPRLRITRKGVKLQAPSARIGRNVGLNVSKSGVSASIRTRLATWNSKRGCTLPCGLLALAYLVGLAAAAVLAQRRRRTQ